MVIMHFVGKYINLSLCGIYANGKLNKYLNTHATTNYSGRVDCADCLEIIND